MYVQLFTVNGYLMKIRATELWSDDGGRKNMRDKNQNEPSPAIGSLVRLDSKCQVDSYPSSQPFLACRSFF
jgi:hypothetical protein